MEEYGILEGKADAVRRKLDFPPVTANPRPFGKRAGNRRPAAAIFPLNCNKPALHPILPFRIKNICCHSNIALFPAFPYTLVYTVTIQTSDRLLQYISCTRHFSYIATSNWLLYSFEGTVRENLVYNNEKADEEKMKEACRAVGLDHFIRTLPQGYDTVLNDQVNLSQGQKQQLTIARAMIANNNTFRVQDILATLRPQTGYYTAPRKTLPFQAAPRACRSR